MVASWWQHTALFLFLFDVKGRWAVFNNLETFLITDRAYQIDFYKNVGPRFNPGALNQHPRLLHGPPLATNSTSYALLPPTWPLMHFSHQLPNAFQRMRMMHRIIYVATNFLSKIAFFRDHGESSLSTLDVNPGCSSKSLQGVDQQKRPPCERCPGLEQRILLLGGNHQSNGPD